MNDSRNATSSDATTLLRDAAKAIHELTYGDTKDEGWWVPEQRRANKVRERIQAFLNAPSTETRNEPMRDALQRLVAAVDDMEGMDEADGVEFHTAESVLESALLNARESLKNAAPQGVGAAEAPTRLSSEVQSASPAVAAPQSLSSSIAASSGPHDDNGHMDADADLERRVESGRQFRLRMAHSPNELMNIALSANDLARIGFALRQLTVERSAIAGKEKS